MGFDGSGDKGTSASVALTSPQAELLRLLDKLVSLAASDAMTNIQALPEVCIRPSIEVCVGILPRITLVPHRNSQSM